MNVWEAMTKVAKNTVGRNVIGIATALAAAGGVAAFAGAAYFAREVVVPKTMRKEDLLIRRVFYDDDGALHIDLPASPQTTAPGRYSLWFAAGSGHACVGRVTGTDAEAGTVTRIVERVDTGDLTTVKAGIWSGYVFSKPDQLNLPYSEVQIATSHGVAPAWIFPHTNPSDASTKWAIHIHGMGGSRAGALRGVPVARRLGYTTLVVSLRNDREGPASTDARYMLGQTEWLDVEEAVKFAISEGAQEILLFGWSLGGSIALRLADLSEYSGYISGLVLDAPVLDWTRTLTTNARASGLPGLIASLGLLLMQSRAFGWVTGLEEPLDFRSLDWVAQAVRLHKPILILHGRGDLSTPFEASELAAKLRPDLIQLVPFEVEGHSQEWNVDPEKWESAVASWILGLSAEAKELDEVEELTETVAKS
ncbi:alpha/beta hydrolase family protein [Arthrobacter rhizosphaerae]|uniref:alpha/beta hydrolase family protein n=1 Tax=Arthrobacter rhizosphaerae TaxID=2855490 RepID=UPI001FF50B2F|nr:alpha/beta fold hydrolase [Arthrobacter rhizosphaerae]